VTCQAWLVESGGTCGNTVASSASCDKCEHVVARCPECGGIEAAQRQMAAHATTHSTEGKRAGCRVKGCGWKSDESYHPDNDYAKERVFEEQRRHYSSAHPKLYRQIRAHAMRSNNSY